MSERAAALAAAFEHANGVVIHSIEACSDTEWQTTCPCEG